MKKIVLFLTLILLTSCSLQNEENVYTATKDTKWAQSLVQSGTWDIKIDLSKKYHYLDSLEKNEKDDTFGDIISQTPYTIVYFYPKDGTPNCTIQAMDFSVMLKDFEAKGYNVIGVSKDDLASHKKFAESNHLKIKLLQDKNSDLLKEFWALWELKEYGNGTDKSDIIRSTFIIDKNGTPLYAFKDVEAIGHAQRIYNLISK